MRWCFFSALELHGGFVWECGSKVVCLVDFSTRQRRVIASRSGSFTLLHRSFRYLYYRRLGGPRTLNMVNERKLSAPNANQTLTARVLQNHRISRIVDYVFNA
jgi:hypothetical protein